MTSANSNAGRESDARVQPAPEQVDVILAQVEAMSAPTSVTPRASSQDSLRRYTLQDPGVSPEASLRNAPKGSTASPPWLKRGAWSDVERKSVHSELIPGYVPGRAVARDLTRLLRSMESSDRIQLASTNRLDSHLNDIHGQLLNIAARLKGHSDDLKYDPDAGSLGDHDELPTLADKGEFLGTVGPRCNYG